MIDLITSRETWGRLLAKGPIESWCTPRLVEESGIVPPHEHRVPSIAYAGPDLALNGIAAFLDSLLKAEGLAWLQTCAAGVEEPVYAKLAAQEVTVTNNHATASAIAEYVMAVSLDYLQRGAERRAAAGAGEWRRLFFREARGSKWFIVGLGAIGREVATKARAFGAHVTAVRRDGLPDADADRVTSYDRFPALVEEADVIVLAAALGSETRHLVNDALLSRLAPGRTLLVNVARGPIVDEEALRRGLMESRPDAACLDVFDVEPLPAGSWLWTHPRVAVTAHAAALGSGVVSRSDDLFLENLLRYRDTRPLLNDVTATLQRRGAIPSTTQA